MDPVTELIFSSSTLFGLLANYVQEKRSQKDRSAAGFRDWLEQHQFQQLKDHLEGDRALFEQLDTFLQLEFDAMSGKLEVIEGLIQSVLEKIEGLERVGSVEDPTHEISEEAWDILRCFAASGASEMVFLNSHPSITTVKFLGYPEGRAEGSRNPKVDPRFLKNDLDTLDLVGWISLARYSERDGNPVYSLTRKGVKAAGELS